MGEATLPHTKTQQTIAAVSSQFEREREREVLAETVFCVVVVQVDRLLEAVEVWRIERGKMAEHAEACKAAGKEVLLKFLG